jgi:ribosomal protein S21
VSLATYEPIVQLGRSRTPTRAAVTVVDGDVGAALRALKKAATRDGLYTLINRRSHLYAYVKPGEARRRKSGRARARDRKAAMKQAERELRRDPHGKRPLPREEVTAAAA